MDRNDTYDDVHVDVSVDVSTGTSAKGRLADYSMDLPVNIYNVNYIKYDIETFHKSLDYNYRQHRAWSPIEARWPSSLRMTVNGRLLRRR